MISTEAVASRQGPADRSGLRSWLNRVSLLPVATTFSSSAWTHGDLTITVRLWLQDGVVTIEVSDAGPGLTLFSGSRPLGTGGRGFPSAAAIAQEMGVHSRACKATVWARLHFRWVAAETEPGAIS
jgi:hypothetical protein